jgi:hypothetical protein
MSWWSWNGKDLEGIICLVELRATTNTPSKDSRYSGRDLKQHLPDTSHRHHHSIRFPVSQRLSVWERTPQAISCNSSCDLGCCLRRQVQTVRGVHTRRTSASKEHWTSGWAGTHFNVQRNWLQDWTQGFDSRQNKEISLQIYKTGKEASPTCHTTGTCSLSVIMQHSRNGS